MQVWTENSIYEISGNRIRRLNGSFDPTPRQGPDGEWKDFAYISTPKVGEPLKITWALQGQTMFIPSGIEKNTVTSPVTWVQDELLEDE
jgi:hypothetical protein